MDGFLQVHFQKLDRNNGFVWRELWEMTKEVRDYWIQGIS